MNGGWTEFHSIQEQALPALIRCNVPLRALSCAVCPNQSANFHNADNSFRFRYSVMSVRCTEQSHRAGDKNWLPPDSCDDENCDDRSNGTPLRSYALHTHTQ